MMATVLALVQSATPELHPVVELGLKIMLGALIGWVANSLTVGKRIDNLNVSLSTKLTEIDRKADSRMQRIEQAMWGTEHIGGGVHQRLVEVEDLQSTDHELLLRVSGQVEGVFQAIGALTELVKRWGAGGAPPRQ